ncbi:MAG: hypothetical protein Fur0037_02770 [Planctomycetota bacterium]
MTADALYDTVRAEMERFFGGDARRIAHAIEVAGHARWIQAAEGGDREIVTMAGLLHDVGIKPGEERFGRNDGKIQEELGPPIAEEILRRIGVEAEKVAAVSEIIAFHHTPGRVRTKEFACLWDADLIANLREVAGGMSREKIDGLIEEKFLTGEGRRIARAIHLPPPVAELMGMRPVSCGGGGAVFEMEAGKRHHNPMGTVHGGILCDLADAAMGYAFATTLGPRESFTTLELKINFLRPVFETKLTASARVVHRGRTIGLVECDVVNGEGKPVARASSTCSVLRGEDAKGR